MSGVQASPDEAAGGSLCHNSAQRGRQLSLTFHQTAPRQPPPLLTQSRIALRWLRILASLLLYEEKEHAGHAQQTRTRLLKCSKSSSLPMRSLPPSSILMATAQASRTKRAALWQAQARRQGTDRRQTSAWQSSLLAARPHLGPKLPKPSCPPWNHTLSLKEEVVLLCCSAGRLWTPCTGSVAGFQHTLRACQCHVQWQQAVAGAGATLRPVRQVPGDAGTRAATESGSRALGGCKCQAPWRRQCWAQPQAAAGFCGPVRQRPVAPGPRNPAVTRWSGVAPAALQLHSGQLFFKRVCVHANTDVLDVCCAARHHPNRQVRRVLFLRCPGREERAQRA